MSENLLTIIVGGSGTGKTTIAEELVRQGRYTKAITCTTRNPRDGEKNGVDYHFVDKDELFKMHEHDELIESPTKFGSNWYGCPKTSVLNSNKPVVLIMEFEGLNKVYDMFNHHSEITLAPVFLEPIPKEELIKRLSLRNSTEDEIKERVVEMDKESSWGDSDLYKLRISQDLSLSKDENIKRSTLLINNLIDSLTPELKKQKHKM